MPSLLAICTLIQTFVVICDGWLEGGSGSERWTFVDSGNGRFALHHGLSNRFLRIYDERVNGGAGVCDIDKLPPENVWPCERFIVVTHPSPPLIGRGLELLNPGSEIALMGWASRRFLQIKDTGAVRIMSDFVDTCSLEQWRACERFTVRGITPSQMRAHLHSPYK